ncbi:LamG-like jellyroll fold domain-containing protein [Sedimentisphaera salicampi]|uniref:LamG-like jellyroll fold domain-containing protein n=1 Tax=Sedimentisphaera salicampi TaxID=1941349 RepID=A0A1W6LJ42_9BACT|nr:LamG-like jellyroll fold domain-containing protein [Sedimentisphaera salicampi]ARN55775.1 hypothetical protein STSP1_00140 [Sedimentisphaera salicampi]
MKLLKFSFFCISAFALSICFAENLITDNADFESDAVGQPVSGWFKDSAITASGNGPSRPGSKSAYLAGGTEDYGLRSRGFEVTSGETYRLTFDYKTAGTTNGNPEVRFLFKENAVIDSIGNVDGDFIGAEVLDLTPTEGTWETLSVASSRTGTDIAGLIRITKNKFASGSDSFNGEVWIDNVKIYLVETDPDNLFSNPGFETGDLTNWYKSSGVNVISDNGESLEGIYAAEIPAGDDIRTVKTNAAYGDGLEISFDYKVNSDASFEAVLRYFDNDGGGTAFLSQDSYELNPTDDWAVFQLEKTITQQNTDEIDIRFIADTASSGELIIDNLSAKFAVFENQSPLVDAGISKLLRLDSSQISEMLEGAFTDDGLPSDSSPSVLWTVLDKPEGSSIVFNPNNGSEEESDVLSPEVIFSETGDYLLELCVDDGQLQACDQVEFNVRTPDYFGVTAKYDFNSNMQDSAAKGSLQDDLSEAPNSGSTANYLPGILGDSFVLSNTAEQTGEPLVYSELTDDLNLPAAYTIEGFIRPHPDNFDDGQVNRIFSTLGFFAGIDSSNSLFVYHNQQLSGTVELAGGNLWPHWHHFAVTGDYENLKLYVDGVLADTKSYDGTIDNFSGVWRETLNPAGFKGLVDEIQFHNEARDQAYIESRAQLIMPTRDLFYDRIIDEQDIMIFAHGWLNSFPCNSAADLNHDCNVDISDFAELSLNWLHTF